MSRVSEMKELFRDVAESSCLHVPPHVGDRLGMV